VGHREFDTKRVGVLVPAPGTVSFVFDTTKSGNSNEGHDVGTTLVESDKWHLLEYLKTL
jgi:hypothetical protein